MWKLERLSLYSDLRISMVFYGRFYDDINSTASNKRRAQLMCNLIEAEDPDQLIRLTLDYPTTKDDYTPFLNIEAKIREDGNIDTRLYRKPQKKLLTLNSNSHHPTAVKHHTVANMYETADMVSSSEHNKKHSESMVDELLLNNGYSNRALGAIKTNKNKKRVKKSTNENIRVATLKIPYLSDQCTARIKRAAAVHKIPLRVVTTPGRKLKHLLTSSRPQDQLRCPNRNCVTCNSLTGRGKCTDSNVVYGFGCALGNCYEVKIGQYDGETYRPTHERFGEHYRSARNPTADSYKFKPLAKHYVEYHPNCQEPKFNLKIIKKANSTNNRKIVEARTILKNKSDLNNKDEQTDLKRFLI